ncbi:MULTISPECIES: hypothetical protein [Enterobacteriaceae]|jgi:hypothetical protein|uniref:SinR family protein n=9 Tax=Enterobacteriaceae TaxID=543 RepID=A0A927DKF0_9ENTR|nr:MULTISPECIES: hypothetical protein [Enterobacteriaceae]EBF8640277.1 hypothetical protein [Salmonella enterica subsp. enterica serovar Nigeria]EFH9378676.1 hypothetical protein [Escherichia coli]EFO2082252.1 hypothetical protein [Escherichia coli O409]EGQ5322417.1 hypothetical protein [Enterobacter asburiae]MDU4304866.1 hypothetical protein [Enterococcus faecalis]OXU55236.1 hypothetical protein CEB48_24790 [Klebsiella pneumoniae subsp. pneumoniae]SST41633.1 Uncharacterised protein [Acineto
MSVYCVSYDLNQAGQNYNALYDELKKSPGWCHPLDSTWLISTGETAQQLSDRLRRHLDNNDTLLVIGVTKEYAGWLTQDTWDWMRTDI